MGDKALRGNRLTAQGGGRIAGPARRAQEHGFYSPDMGMRGRFGYKHGGKTKTPEHYLVHGYGSTYKPKRTKKAIGSLVKAAKTIKEKLIRPHGPIKKKKKVHPETEDLTHQKGPYGGDVGSERKKFKKGGTDKKWIQKAVDPKHKGFCTPMTKKTCTPRRKALARTFKKMGRERKAKG